VKPDRVVFFESAAALRAWLSANHGSERQLWIGLHKKGSGGHGIAYTEAVDEALCFGWIDGQLSGMDEQTYALRFTPRRADSLWSTANVKRVAQLIETGRMQEAGLQAFEARRPDRTGMYINDMLDKGFPSEMEAMFRADAGAWAFWSRQPPSYRRQMIWWVVSAKRDDTRQRRLTALIAEHAAGRRIDPLRLPRLGARSGHG
jgi:uncharacterized protein YdeI (YjbR/CyaY-like superfamily)